jgi:hypothetical protein
LARPEFLDERPAWLSGQENAASLTLSPLSAAESKKLLGALGVGGEGAKQIAEAAEGNPLYAEQMAAMVAEDGAVDAVPPTIQALLAARLDRLSSAERRAIERPLEGAPAQEDGGQPDRQREHVERGHDCRDGHGAIVRRMPVPPPRSCTLGRAITKEARCRWSSSSTTR